MPGGGKGVADVLRGLIDDMSLYANLAIVVAAVLGVFLAGYALLRLYQVNQSGEGAAVGWIFAIVIGSAMTCIGVVLGALSFWFAE